MILQGKLLLLVASSSMLLLFGHADGQERAAVKQRPADRVNCTISFQQRPLLLGDVAFAEVRYTNNSKQSFDLPLPDINATYKYGLGSEKAPGWLEASLGVYPPLRSDLRIADDGPHYETVQPGDSLTDICLVRIHGLHDSQNYPKVESIQGPVQIAIPSHFHHNSTFRNR